MHLTTNYANTDAPDLGLCVWFLSHDRKIAPLVRRNDSFITRPIIATTGRRRFGTPAGPGSALKQLRPDISISSDLRDWDEPPVSACQNPESVSPTDSRCAAPARDQSILLPPVRWRWFKTWDCPPGNYRFGFPFLVFRSFLLCKALVVAATFLYNLAGSFLFDFIMRPLKVLFVLLPAVALSAPFRPLHLPSVGPNVPAPATKDVIRSVDGADSAPARE